MYNICHISMFMSDFHELFKDGSSLLRQQYDESLIALYKGISVISLHSIVLVV